MERETGIEPATNGLGSRYSTIELLPLRSASSIAGVTRMHTWRRGAGATCGLLVWSYLLLCNAASCPRAWAASPGGELSAWILAEDARLGAAPGTITVDQPGRISTPVTLGLGHNLQLQAAVEWAATVRLSGKNVVACAPGVAITARLPAYQAGQTNGIMLLAEGAAGLRVQGCTVRSLQESLLIKASAVADLTVSDNKLEGLVLGVMQGPPARDQALVFSRNSVTGPMGGSKNPGLGLDHVQGVTVSGNSFTRLIHGAMWWGGDSAAPGMSVKQVNTTGAMAFTGNVCKDVGGSCIWGSMGHDIVMRGNTADGCGDVCFDTEGGLRTQIVDNTATRCGNGCAAIFFFTDDTTIDDNHFRAQVPGGGLIFIKNSAQDPLRHDHLRIEGNELRCMPNLCRAVYQEAASGIQFLNNEVTNGVWLPVAYARSVVIAGNHFVFTQPVANVPAAIWTPGVLGGTALEVLRNRVESNVTQPAGTACVVAGWTDFNFTDYHVIAGNICGGTAPFPAGIRAVSAGTNPGVAGVWVLSANQLGRGSVEHTPKPNERFFDLGECGASGCTTDATSIQAMRAQQGCSGGAPAPAAGMMPVCLGPVRGWSMVPVSR